MICYSGHPPNDVPACGPVQGELRAFMLPQKAKDILVHQFRKVSRLSAVRSTSRSTVYDYPLGLLDLLYVTCYAAAVPNLDPAFDTMVVRWRNDWQRLEALIEQESTTFLADRVRNALESAIAGLEVLLARNPPVHDGTNAPKPSCEGAHVEVATAPQYVA